MPPRCPYTAAFEEGGHKSIVDSSLQNRPSPNTEPANVSMAVALVVDTPIPSPPVRTNPLKIRAAGPLAAVMGIGSVNAIESSLAIYSRRCLV